MSFFFLLSYRRLSSFTACRSHSQTQKFTTFASVNSFWESWAKRAINERLRCEEKLWKLAVSWFLEGLITAVWDQPSSRMGLETDRRTDMRLNDGSASAQVTATLSLNTHTHTQTLSQPHICVIIREVRVFPQSGFFLKAGGTCQTDGSLHGKNGIVWFEHFPGKCNVFRVCSFARCSEMWKQEDWIWQYMGIWLNESRNAIYSLSLRLRKNHII